MYHFFCEYPVLKRVVNYYNKDSDVSRTTAKSKSFCHKELNLRFCGSPRYASERNPSASEYCDMHFVKSVRIRSYSGLYFPVFGHFLRSDLAIYF